MGMPTTYMVTYGIKVFLLIWVIFVPIVISSRLERIIQLLEEKK
jgi:hypothetical protein